MAAKIEVEFMNNVVWDGRWFAIGKTYVLKKEEYEVLKQYCKPVQKKKEENAEEDKKGKQK